MKLLFLSTTKFSSNWTKAKVIENAKETYVTHSTTFALAMFYVNTEVSNWRRKNLNLAS